MPKKEMIGVVISNKMDKTVVVKVETKKRHKLYKKVFRRSKKYKAHDEQNTCNIGDVILIKEERPISREKRWQVIEIVRKYEL